MLPETGERDPIKGLLSDCSDTEAARMGEIEQAEKDPFIWPATTLYEACDK